MRGSAAFRASVAPGGALAGPWVRNELWRRARAVPSLDLQFADNKSLVDATTGTNLIDFSRLSSGTYVDSQGVIRNAVTNLAFGSENFATYWANAFSVDTGNSAIAPNGTNTGTLLVNTADSQAHTIFQTNTFAAGSCSFSLYVKYIDHQWIAARIGAAGNQFFGSWDLLNGTTGSFTSGATIAITPAGGNWYRITLTATLSSTGSSNIVVGLNNSDSASFTVYSGTGSGIYIWGAQLEQSSTVGEYIPTTSAINSAPRFDHNPTTGESLGLLVEEQRTNSIRNNTMVGAVAGTPGTLPTNWGFSSAITGITTSVIGTGTSNGITYVDVRYQGTASITTANVLQFEGNTQASATAGQSWTASSYVALVAGSFANVDAIGITLRENDSGGVFLRQVIQSLSLATSSFARFTSTAILGASVAYVNTGIRFLVASGSVIDFTLRIGLPQLEQGAFATSVIPTSGTTATRSADVAIITGSNFSSWYRQDEGTVFAEGSSNSPSFPQFAEVSDGTVVNRVTFGYLTQSLGGLIVRNGGSIVAQLYPSASSVNRKVAYSFATDAYAACAEDRNVLSTSSGTLYSSMSKINIGSNVVNAASSTLNGTIRRLTYWQTRLPNDTLQTITN